MKYSILETFVGAGGAHLGFLNAGFKSVFINDIDINCLKTITFNNKSIEKDKCIVSSEDIVKIDGHKILSEIKMIPGELDLMFGGIVCKGFSLAGERSPSDPRNTYYRYQLNLVNVLKPKISIIENVPGILNSKILSAKTPKDLILKVDSLWKKIENYKGKKANFTKLGISEQDFINYGKDLRIQRDELTLELEKSGHLVAVKEDILQIYNEIGYVVNIKVLNSADFGSATKRDRVIIVALRKDLKIDYTFPTPKYNETEYKTVEQALNSFKRDKDDTDDIPMKHNEKTIRRLKYLKAGVNFSEIIDKLPQDLKISKFYSRGSTMRLNPNRPSPTLVPGHSNFPIHPKYDRSITVREAAIITGFPSDYKFFGSHTKRCEQVGNAVPPDLSYAIALSAKESLNKYYKKPKGR